MRKLLLIAALLGLAARGPHRVQPAQSPRDVAVNGSKPSRTITNSASTGNKLVIVPPPPVPSAQMLQVLTNRPPCWPNCTNTQLPHDWWGFTWEATNMMLNAYLVCSSTNRDFEDYSGYTNVIEQVTPDHRTHTNWVKLDRTVDLKWYRLYELH